MLNKIGPIGWNYLFIYFYFLLVHLTRRLKCIIVIMRCPSSVRRLSSLTFHIYDFFSETTERNLTKLNRKQDLNVLYQVCVFGPIGKQDGHPGLWLAKTFSTSTLKPSKGIQRNFTRSKISTSSTKFVFFGLIGKTRRPPWPLIGWGIFDFPSETAEQNSTKLDRKQDINVLYQACVIRAVEKQNYHTGISLAKTFSTFPLKLLNGIQQKLTGSKILKSSTKVLFFRADQ